MTGFFEWILSGVVGAAVGLFYFAALWWTVRRLPTTGQPAVLMIVSLAIRLGVALAVILVFSQGRWDRLLPLMVGLLIARFILVHRLKPRMTADRSYKEA